MTCFNKTKAIDLFENFNSSNKFSIAETDCFNDFYSMAYQINYECNFNCFYCITGQQNKINNYLDYTQIADAFNKTNKTWLIGFTGGEPFVFPNFIKLLSALSKKHYFDINTNLSTKSIYDLTTIYDVDKIICIYAAFHVQERVRLGLVDDFINKVLFLQKNNIRVIVNYLAHPIYLDRVKDDFDFLKSKGIKSLSPKKFIGEYNNKIYPDAYTKNEIELLKSLKNCFELDLVDFDQNTKGRRCLAGKKYFFMTPDGELFQCSSVYKKHGNFFKGNFRFNILTKKCPSSHCGCIFEGLLLSKK